VPDLSRINPLLAKIIAVMLLTLVLLIPLGRVASLITERAALRDGAVERVAKGVGHAQSIGAVMMIVPVTRTWMVDGKECSETRSYRVLADSVEIVGGVSSELRRSGIYTVPTFASTIPSCRFRLPRREGFKGSLRN
jgi:inner membrane protein